MIENTLSFPFPLPFLQNDDLLPKYKMQYLA